VQLSFSQMNLPLSSTEPILAQSSTELFVLADCTDIARGVSLSPVGVVSPAMAHLRNREVELYMSRSGSGLSLEIIRSSSSSPGVEAIEEDWLGDE
jgi:hypothetical protein